MDKLQKFVLKENKYVCIVAVRVRELFGKVVSWTKKPSDFWEAKCKRGGTQIRQAHQKPLYYQQRSKPTGPIFFVFRLSFPLPPPPPQPPRQCLAPTCTCHLSSLKQQCIADVAWRLSKPYDGKGFMGPKKKTNVQSFLVQHLLHTSKDSLSLQTHSHPLQLISTSPILIILATSWGLLQYYRSH